MVDPHPASAPTSAGPSGGAPALRQEGRLESARAARRARILEAARDLASAGGYAAVTMHDVAEQAEVSRATVYRYYSSKDHLIADVHLEQGAAIVQELQGALAPELSPAERLSQLCGRIVDVASADLRLTEAGVFLALSDDPAVLSAEQWRRELILPYLRTALDPGTDAMSPWADEDLDTVAEVMQAVLFHTLLTLVRGRQDVEGAKSLLTRAAHRLLD